MSNFLLKKYLSEQKLLKEDTAEKLIDSLFGFQIYLIKEFNIRVSKAEIDLLINGATNGYIMVVKALSVCQSAVEYERVILDKKNDKDLQNTFDSIHFIPLLKKISSEVISKSSSPSGIVLKTLEILKLNIHEADFHEKIFIALLRLSFLNIVYRSKTYFQLNSKSFNAYFL